MTNSQHFEEALSEISAATPEIVAWIRRTAEQAEGFVLEQAPLVVQEYIAWFFWQNAISVFIWLAFAIPAGVIALRFGGRSIAKLDLSVNEARVDGRDALVVVSGVVLLFCLLSLVRVVPDGKDAIKALVAPRVVLIEWAGGVL